MNLQDLFQTNYSHSQTEDDEDLVSPAAALIRGDQQVFYNQLPSNSFSTSQRLSKQQIEFSKRQTNLSKHKRSNYLIREEDSQRFSSTSRGGRGLASRRSNSNQKLNQTAVRGSRLINKGKCGNFYAHRVVKNRRATTSGEVDSNVKESDQALKRSLIINSNRRYKNQRANLYQTGNKIIVHRIGQYQDKRIYKQQQQQQSQSSNSPDTNIQGSRIQGLRRLAAANNANGRIDNTQQNNKSNMAMSKSYNNSSKGLTANQRRMQYHQNFIQQRGSRQGESDSSSNNNKNSNQNQIRNNNELHYRVVPHTNSENQFATFNNEERQSQKILNRSVQLQKEVQNLKNARRDKLSNSSNSSADRQIFKMKQFLVKTSSNDLNGREILELLDGKKGGLKQKSGRDFSKVEEIIRSKADNKYNSPVKKQQQQQIR